MVLRNRAGGPGGPPYFINLTAGFIMRMPNRQPEVRHEFVDSNHLPVQLYVREGRRMVGKSVYTQADTGYAAGDDARSVFHPTSKANTVDGWHLFLGSGQEYTDY